MDFRISSGGPCILFVFYSSSSSSNRPLEHPARRSMNSNGSARRSTSGVRPVSRTDSNPDDEACLKAMVGFNFLSLLFNRMFDPNTMMTKFYY